jgi:hypothetical protein
VRWKTSQRSLASELLIDPNPFATRSTGILPAFFPRLSPVL